MSGIRRVALGFWLLLTVILLGLYASNPDLLEPETLVNALRQSGPYVVLGYVGLSVVRPITLIPSTALIIAGTLLFPDRHWFVFASSLAGVVASAALIYFFFEFLGLAALFERKHASRARWLEHQVRTKGFWIVVGWSAFPFVPTDLICYVAGTLRMNVGKFLAGVALGELPIVGLYVAGGVQLFSG